MKDIAVMYHYVKTNDWKGIVSLEPEIFEQQIDILNKSYEIVSPDDLRKPRGLKPRCVLTFDDGTKDQYTIAFQIMKNKGVPGYFTVMSSPLLDEVVPIFHLVHIVLSFHSDEEIWGDLRGRYDVDEVPQLSGIYSYEKDIYRRYNKYAFNFFLTKDQARDYLQEKAIKVFGTSKNLIDQYYVSKNEFMEMKSQGMTIGVHCAHHTPYCGDANIFYKDEIEPCGLFLKNELNITPEWYTPAFGGGEQYKAMFRDLEPILREHGYKAGFATTPGKNNGLSNFWLNRYDCIHVPPFKSIEN
ncbi:polysaccharide deacetylase family protein [Cohnella panacarvi]|uniref:polysaccharide deacetylase family protein n=1 Tax=Cohnella panacarvi TaxID=400776 RepID=UPI0004798084|nr:polysaccharide deacetylase family protein [Cohnella panacarvi]